MDGTYEWKRLKLYEGEECSESTEEKKQGATDEGNTFELRQGTGEQHSSAYLIARDEQQEERRKELLYRVLGPVFFGKKEAESWQELAALFQRRYGIDVENDFYEGDEHYEEYMEAQQAIAEGMSIYSGSIVFEESILAEYAELLWDGMEQMEKKRFRRINTMLEE